MLLWDDRSSFIHILDIDKPNAEMLPGYCNKQLPKLENPDDFEELYRLGYNTA
jgi:hypothetical protein